MQPHLATYNKSIIFQTTGLGPKYHHVLSNPPHFLEISATTSAHKSITQINTLYLFTAFFVIWSVKSCIHAAICFTLSPIKIMYFLNRLYSFSLSTDSKKHNHAFENSRGQ